MVPRTRIKTRWSPGVLVRICNPKPGQVVAGGSLSLAVQLERSWCCFCWFSFSKEKRWGRRDGSVAFAEDPDLVVNPIRWFDQVRGF